MKVFIACSTSHLVGKKNPNSSNNSLVCKEKTSDNIDTENSLAFRLCTDLKKIGHETQPWWNDEVIRDGEDFFKKIISLSHSCDTGIFILNNEHKLEYTKLAISSSNVYVELGIFIAEKGLDNVIFIVEENVKVPSDFNALNIIQYPFPSTSSSAVNEEYAKILAVVKERFHRIEHYRESNYDHGKLYLNHDTMETILNRPKVTQNWNSKSAYIGMKAAQIWADIELNPIYLPESFKYKFRTFLRSNEIQKNLKEISNIISLGSGIGTLDEEICRAIPFIGPISYVPIEINPFLAIQALNRTIRSIINLNDSYAIIDDFESQTSQLKEFITSTIVKTEKKSLFLLLGGTFCNLDNQHGFLTNWSQIIGINDYFLFDVFTKREDYEDDFDKEQRVKSEITKLLIDNVIEGKFETSLSFQESNNAKRYLTLSMEQRQKKLYEEYVDIIVETTKNKSTLFIWKFKIDKYESNDTATLFKVKRHDFKNIRRKIKHRFSEISYFDINVGFGLNRTYFVTTHSP